MQKDDATPGEIGPSKKRENARRSARLHDRQSIYVSLKQWRILHAVVDFGGVSEAASHLHLSQSAVSYTIGKMQEQLGVQLLQIVGRRARLTEAGKEVLDRSRHMLRKAIELEQIARHLAEGRKPMLRIAVDALYPSRLLVRALQSFARQNPEITVSVSELGSRPGNDTLDDLSADIAITTSKPDGQLVEPLLGIDCIAVAHASHPLAREEGVVNPAELERWVRIGPPSPFLKSHRGSKELQTGHWSISDTQLALDAVSGGLGYAWLPLHRIQPQLEQGTLRAIRLGESASYTRTLHLVYRRPLSGDGALGMLVEAIRREAVASAAEAGASHDRDELDALGRSAGTTRLAATRVHYLKSGATGRGPHYRSAPILKP